MWPTSTTETEKVRLVVLVLWPDLNFYMATGVCGTPAQADEATLALPLVLNSQRSCHSILSDFIVWVPGREVVDAHRNTSGPATNHRWR